MQFRFDRGCISPYFVTNAEKMRAEMEDPFLLVHEKKLSALNELLALLEAVVQAGKPLLIIAEDVEGEALAALVVNKLRGGLKVAAARLPVLVIAARLCCRTSPFSLAARPSLRTSASSLRHVKLDMLGKAKKVIRRGSPLHRRRAWQAAPRASRRHSQSRPRSAP